MSAPLTPGVKRTILRAVTNYSSSDIARIAAAAFADSYALTWAEVLWTDPSGANGAFAGLRERDAGNGEPGREFIIDEPTIRRGLRLAIESAVVFRGADPERAIAWHLRTIPDSAFADRVIQFAILDSDAEVYYTGAGVES